MLGEFSRAWISADRCMAADLTPRDTPLFSVHAMAETGLLSLPTAILELLLELMSDSGVCELVRAMSSCRTLCDAGAAATEIVAARLHCTSRKSRWKLLRHLALLERQHAALPGLVETMRAAAAQTWSGWSFQMRHEPPHTHGWCFDDPTEHARYEGLVRTLEQVARLDKSVLTSSACGALDAAFTLAGTSLFNVFSAQNQVRKRLGDLFTFMPQACVDLHASRIALLLGSNAWSKLLLRVSINAIDSEIVGTVIAVTHQHSTDQRSSQPPDGA